MPSHANANSSANDLVTESSYEATISPKDDHAYSQLQNIYPADNQTTGGMMGTNHDYVSIVAEEAATYEETLSPLDEHLYTALKE